MITQKQLTEYKKYVNEVENAYLKAQIARLSLDERLAAISGELWDKHQCFCRFKTDKGIVIYWHEENSQILELTFEEFMDKVSELLEQIIKSNMLPFED